MAESSNFAFIREHDPVFLQLARIQTQRVSAPKAKRGRKQAENA